MFILLYSLSFPKNCRLDFGILKDVFMISLGQMCCEEETVNSIIEASVVLQNLLRIREGLFRELGETFATNSQPVLV